MAPSVAHAHHKRRPAGTEKIAHRARSAKANLKIDDFPKFISSSAVCQAERESMMKHQHDGIAKARYKGRLPVSAQPG